MKAVSLIKLLYNVILQVVTVVKSKRPLKFVFAKYIVIFIKK